MNELEKLKAEKKLLEEKIRQLEMGTQTCGCAKLDFHKYARGTEWYVAIKTLQPDKLNNSRWLPLCAAKTPQGAMNTIDTIIHDLQALKTEYEKGKI